MCINLSIIHICKGCRSLLAGGEVIASIRAVGITTGSCQVLELDLKSLKSVYTFAATVLQEVDRIDLLINNGIYLLTTRTCTLLTIVSPFKKINIRA